MIAWYVGNYELGSAPTTKDAQAIADQLYAEFVSEEADKVEIIYSKFVSLITSTPTVQTMLPLTPEVRCTPPSFIPSTVVPLASGLVSTCHSLSIL